MLIVMSGERKPEEKQGQRSQQIPPPPIILTQPPQPQSPEQQTPQLPFQPTQEQGQQPMQQPSAEQPLQRPQSQIPLMPPPYQQPRPVLQPTTPTMPPVQYPAAPYPPTLPPPIQQIQPQPPQEEPFLPSGSVHRAFRHALVIGVPLAVGGIVAALIAAFALSIPTYAYLAMGASITLLSVAFMVTSYSWFRSLRIIEGELGRLSQRIMATTSQQARPIASMPMQQPLPARVMPQPLPMPTAPPAPPMAMQQPVQRYPPQYYQQPKPSEQQG